MNPPSTVSGWTPLPSSLVAGPSSNVPPLSNAGTSASATTNNKKRRPQAAYDILGAFYRDVTDRPTKQERLKLAEQVRGIPGCEDYKSTDVSGYFSRKRKADARASNQPELATPPVAMTKAKILYPSLARGPKSLQRLEVLLGDDPDPSAEIAAIWAERIGYNAKAKDILTYARLRRAQKVHAPLSPSSPVSTMPALPRLPPFSAPRTQASHLPTPSISPEPASLPTSPVVESPGISGRITATISVKEEEDELESDEDMDLEDSDSEIEVPLSTMVAHASTALQSRVQNDVVTSLQKAFLQPRSPLENDASAPRSFAQFSRWIGGQDQAATALLDEISKGTYAHLGLKPGALSGPPPRT
ncbi:hypothetical protein LXA43DRAFT_629936 [Ganoderma leucocontextum]|nr:hypothetical protein LXA43DRAFT_629936 [Ganoderma leucocontextum]